MVQYKLVLHLKLLILAKRLRNSDRDLMNKKFVRHLRSSITAKAIFINFTLRRSAVHDFIVPLFYKMTWRLKLKKLIFEMCKVVTELQDAFVE